MTKIIFLVIVLFSSIFASEEVLERDFRTEYLTFLAYTYAERFLDFQGRGLNRTRVAVGANLKISKIMDFETYYLHQVSNCTNVPTDKAVGSRLKFIS